jgi:hypothetical protein
LRSGARERARKREDLLAATEEDLDRIKAATTRARNPLWGEAAIALKAGAVLGRRKVAKHFRLTITEETLAFARNAEAIAAEAALDGCNCAALRPMGAWDSCCRRDMTASATRLTPRGLARSGRRSARPVPTSTRGSTAPT